MDKRSITSTELAAFARQLREQERAPGTIEKYIRDVSAASAWLRGAEVTRDGAAAWRDSLLARGYTFLGWEDCKIKSLKIQRRLFRDDRRELTREEYQRLLDAAHGLGRERLALLLETICFDFSSTATQPPSIPVLLYHITFIRRGQIRR